MKSLPKFILITTLLFSALIAKTQVIINPEAGNPGPKGELEVRFYYVPDIEIYYDIQKANFIYFNGTRWVYSDALPVSYAYYNLSAGHKVMLYDYTGEKPQSLFKSHKTKYPKGYNGPPPQANPKGKFKEEGKPATELYNIKKSPAKKTKAKKK